VETSLDSEIYPSGTLGGNSHFICRDPDTNATTTLQNDGVIAPGFATDTIIGRLHINANLRQTATGHTQIQIAGRSGAQYDQLAVDGSAQLNGALDVSLSNFSPQGGDEFNVLDFNFNSTTGTYASVNLPPLAAGLSWDTSRLYTLGILAVAGPRLVGDYNRDGVVNAADYTVWRDTLGSTGSLAADGDGDGTIDSGDYAFWKMHFGEHAGSGAAAATPEPASGVMILIGSLAFLIRPEQRRSL
jgi:hypothetical protein